VELDKHAEHVKIYAENAVSGRYRRKDVGWPAPDFPFSLHVFAVSANAIMTLACRIEEQRRSNGELESKIEKQAATMRELDALRQHIIDAACLRDDISDEAMVDTITRLASPRWKPARMESAPTDGSWVNCIAKARWSGAGWESVGMMLGWVPRFDGDMPDSVADDCARRGEGEPDVR
jgi:hypothetical protein